MQRERRPLEGIGEPLVLSRARAGDQHAASELLARYERAVRAIASDYFLRGGTRADLIQEGLWGMAKAIRDWRPDAGVKFSTFAHLCIRRQVLTAVKTSTRGKHAPLTFADRLEQPATIDGGGDATIPRLEVIDGGRDVPREAILNEQLEAVDVAVVCSLTDLERNAWEGITAGWSYEDLAVIHEVEYKVIDNAVQRARHKLAAVLKAAA